MAAVLAMVFMPSPATVPAPAVASPRMDMAGQAREADQQLCSDLNARGGLFYSSYVTMFMSGASGRKSVNVDQALITRAVDSLRAIGSTHTSAGYAPLAVASAPIASEARDLTNAAQAFSAYDHADATALLTAFVGLSVKCYEAGNGPSWFDPYALANGTSSTSAGSASGSAAAPASEYPKQVKLSLIDHRYAYWLGSQRGATHAVQLAPGVYAEMPASGVIGTATDYSSYVGSCTDIRRYSAEHPGGSTCW